LNHLLVDRQRDDVVIPLIEVDGVEARLMTSQRGNPPHRVRVPQHNIPLYTARSNVFIRLAEGEGLNAFFVAAEVPTSKAGNVVGRHSSDHKHAPKWMEFSQNIQWGEIQGGGADESVPDLVIDWVYDAHGAIRRRADETVYPLDVADLCYSIQFWWFRVAVSGCS
jgi:hypothetical protein